MNYDNNYDNNIENIFLNTLFVFWKVSNL